MRVLLAFAVASTMLQAAQPSTTIVHMSARAVQPGEIVRLTVQTASPADAVTVSAFGQPFPAASIDARTWETLVGIDLDVPAARHAVTIGVMTGGETTRVVRSLDVASKTFRTRRLTVEPEYVEPPASVTTRIAAEAARLTAIWNTPSPARLWDGPFVAPVPDAANSAFGSRSVFNGQPRNPHGGADFASPSGRAVRAPNAGRVVLAEDLYFTGRSVVIDHGMGLVSLFAHLSSINVATDAMVATGDILGRVGATGRVTGPHLHWTVRLAGTRVDPLSLMAVLNLPHGAEQVQ